ncbi:MAG: hypothetical protein Kilf2KO_11700 [Rhodospirillales bacterium]
MADYYIAAIYEEADGVAVLFPGVPGCQTCGRDLDEATFMAVDALAGYLEVCSESDEPWPAPLTLDEARRHEDGEGATLYLFLPTPPRRAKPKKVTISLPENWIPIIDAAAAKQGTSRSGYLGQAAMAQARRDAYEQD